MKAAYRWALIAVVGVLALAGGYLAGHKPPAPPSNEALAALQALELPDLDGRLQPLSQWRGKILVVNFWATWCPPCRREIPDFVRLSRDYAGRGVQFVGLSIDQPDKIRAFRDELHVPYPLLVGDAPALQLAAGLGNPSLGLPFTLILAPDGSIAYTHLGGLKADTLERKIRSQLPQ